MPKKNTVGKGITRTSKRVPKPMHSRRRIQTTWNALIEAGRDPSHELIRIADKAEKAKDYATAGNIWKELKSYIDAKMKPINPAEELQRNKQAATLEELQAIKESILSGTVQQIDKAQAIEHEPLEHEKKTIDVSDIL
jgi:hypothetical protein